MAPKCFCGVFAVVLERVGSDVAGEGLDEFKGPFQLKSLFNSVILNVFCCCSGSQVSDTHLSVIKAPSQGRCQLPNISDRRK